MTRASIAGLVAALLLGGACGGAASGSDTVEAGRDRGTPPPATEAKPEPAPTPGPEDVPDAAPAVPDAGDQVAELDSSTAAKASSTRSGSRMTTAAARRRASGLSQADRERVRAMASELSAEARRSVDAMRSELRSVRDERLAALKVEVEAMAADQAGLEELIRKRHAAVAARRPSRRPSSSPGRQERAPFTSRQPTTGEGISTEGYAWPLEGYVTSEYGPRWGKLHAGIDIAAPTGTPILAAKAGEILFTGRYGGYGNLVVVDHGDGAVSLYAHQSRIAVSEGQQVNQGEVLGYVGSTGNSTGPHLHFEVRREGRPANPRGFLP
jgi:murein DD-endopeptidase MepM/ murein hydrolase activator NlpD